jgi:hypothetical protein
LHTGREHDGRGHRAVSVRLQGGSAGQVPRSATRPTLGENSRRAPVLQAR